MSTICCCCCTAAPPPAAPPPPKSSSWISGEWTYWSKCTCSVCRSLRRMCSISAGLPACSLARQSRSTFTDMLHVEDLKEAVEALGDAAVGLRPLLLGVDAHVPVRVEHQSAGSRGLGDPFAQRMPGSTGTKDARRSSLDTVRMSMQCSASRAWSNGS